MSAQVRGINMPAGCERSNEIVPIPPTPGAAVQHDEWRPGGWPLDVIEDDGPGVPPESLSKLFDPFYRVDNSRTRQTGGVGLGLTIVRTCMEACGGRVTARNRESGGLEVSLYLAKAPKQTA